MSKQTAVEFISKGLFNILQEAEDNNILQVGTQNFKRYIEMFEEQAKEMEEQQHKETWFESASQFANESEMLSKKDFKQYYDETYNKYK
jgi:sulfur relay (sulfurtransferase) DsrF/TusC family protein